VGSFSAENAVPLDQLTPENAVSHLQPTDQAVTYMPRHDLDQSGTREIGFGRHIAREAGTDSAELCRAYDVEGRFVGILRAEETQWKPHKIFHHE
jgi:tRNA U55 pseudouridine synthase TruB